MSVWRKFHSREQSQDENYNTVIFVKRITSGGPYHNPREHPEAGQKYLSMVIWKSNWSYLSVGSQAGDLER